MRAKGRIRFLSALLVLAMIVTLLPVSAFAATGLSSVATLVTDASKLKTGDKVIIYTDACNKVMDACGTAGYYNAGVDATAKDGKLTVPKDSVVWDVTVNEDGTYYFSQNGKKLSLDTSYSSMPYDKINDKWSIVAATGGYYIKNVGRGNYIEWYTKGNDYSSYYNITADTEAMFIHNFYLVAVDPYADIDSKLSVYEKVSEPKAGDTVLIVNNYYSKALSSEPMATYYLSGADVTANDKGLITVDLANTEAIQWVVGKNGDSYTFTQGEKMFSGYKSGKYNNISTDATKETGWTLAECDKENSSYYIYNSTMVPAKGQIYLEWYAAKTDFSLYDTADVSANDFGFCFYKLVREGVKPEPTGLPENGDKVVIYNEASAGVMGLAGESNASMTMVEAVVDEGAAAVGNGGLLFTVGVDGSDYTFECGGKYLATNNSEELFLTDDTAQCIKWNLEKNGDGYTMYSKDAAYTFSSGGSSKICIECYSGGFSGWTYKSSTAELFRMSFLPVAEGTTVINGVVNAPTISFNCPDSKRIGEDYTLVFTIDDLADSIDELSIGFDTGLSGDCIENYTVDGRTYTAVFPADWLDGGTGVTFSVNVKNSNDISYRATHTISVVDEPYISEVTPAGNSETGDEKQPVISAVIGNAGENPTVKMTVNGEEVKGSLKDGVYSYTSAEDMADGKYNVIVSVTRQDGKTVSKSWSFNVGKATFQLYFGQLHSHTAEYSDGSGTLAAGLEYVKNLPESANVQFVAFTDHSNYFDSSSAVNPEEAFYDMSKATAASQQKWATYKQTVADFNASQNDVVAIAGYEMTWSGGPGHINTFNSEGVVSRNNSTLNNKTSDAGLKAYYALLSQADGADTMSQLNHPGSTFGNFSDFSYWDAVIDSRIFLVEVGNGEGQIGAGGYYPSYEQYIMALDKGWHVAPTNNQDNHKGKWGNANDARDVILTDDFSEEGIYEAIRSMRVYATEDKNLSLYYTVNDLQLGSSITEVPESLDIKVSVSDPDYSDSISKVEVVVNSGKVIHTWDNPTDLSLGELSVTLAPLYSYYFIRVTEADGDLAVTAPVWVGESLKLGISNLESGTSTPVTGEEMTLTTTFFNSEATDATVKSITYTYDGNKVIKADTTGYTIPASGSLSASVKFTPDVAKAITITATAVVEQGGQEYTFTKDLSLDILNADKLVYIGIDAAHYNEYVAGNYKDNMGNFTTLAAGYSVRTVMLSTSADLIAACSNDKYKAIVLTAPSRRDGSAIRNPYACYTDAEIAAIVSFNAKGGTVIVSGWSDYYEAYSSFPAEDHMAVQQNKLLAALGSSLRINDDGTNDDSLNGGQSQRLYFSSYNFDSFLLDGVDFDADNPNDVMYTERYSQYGGCSIYAVDAGGNPTASLPSSVTPVVYGHSSTYTADSDGDGKVDMKYEFAEGDDRVLVFATEELEGKGMIIVSGATFMSNFEVLYTVSDSGAEKNYSNYKICENLVQYINPVEITPIATVQAQTETGYKYTIEGVVTTNASGYDKDTAFFDCIYVQDETGGVCCFPVAGEYKIGDIVRVTGTTDFYQGEMELQVTEIKKIGENGTVPETRVNAAAINDCSVLGKFVTLKGTVKSFEIHDGLIQTIFVKDSKGSVARVFIDGYISTNNEIKNIEVGGTITVSGVASYDNTFNAPSGPFPRIRVNDRANVICSPKDPYTDIAGSGYHDYIVEANKAGIISGYPDGTYRPKAEVTRAQFITMLYRAYGEPAVTGTLSFKDSGNISKPYQNAVIWGVQNGIIAGYADNTFRPNQNITRAQMATFLYRFLVNVGNADFSRMDIPELTFADKGSIAAPYLKSVETIVALKIMSGTSTTTFTPNGTANRGMAATVILKVYNLAL